MTRFLKNLDTTEKFLISALLALVPALIGFCFIAFSFTEGLAALGFCAAILFVCPGGFVWLTLIDRYLDRRLAAKRALRY